MTDDKTTERSEMWSSELTEDDSMVESTAWDVESIRDNWHPNSVRLPDHLQRRFDAYHKRLDWQMHADREFKKDRHYKPLVIALGLRELQAMDSDSVVDALDDLESNQIVE